MELMETNKKGHCAACGAKIEVEDYNPKENWEEDGYLYFPFQCKCGIRGEDVYKYVGTNGWRQLD